MSVVVEQYRSFHGMVCPPHVSRECIRRFENGSVLFLPCDYKDDELERYECGETLNLISYYALVWFSLTGLSTALGLTHVVEAREFAKWKTREMQEESGDHAAQATPSFLLSLPLEKAALSSNLEPRILVTDYVLNHLSNHHRRRCHDLQRSTSSSITLRLSRAFEYDFRLVGLNVIMLHFESCSSGKQMDDDKETELLHLVEVYHFRNPIVRKLGMACFEALGCLVRFLFGKRSKEKLP